MLLPKIKISPTNTEAFPEWVKVCHQFAVFPSKTGHLTNEICVQRAALWVV